MTKIEFVHSDKAIFAVDITYKVSYDGETETLEHRMTGDVPLNIARLSRSAMSLLASERIVSCAGVFSHLMHSLMFTTNYSKNHQVNDFHRYYDQSFETRYDFEVDECIAFINAGFFSRSALPRIHRGDGLPQSLPP